MIASKSMRRSACALLGVATIVGSSIVLPTRSSAQTSPCAAAGSTVTRWTNATGGDWAVAANWDNGVPDSSLIACITLPGTYLVTTGNDARASAKSLELGGATGTQTLRIFGTPGRTNGKLTLAAQDPTLGIESNASLELGDTQGPDGTGGPTSGELAITSGTLANRGSIVSRVVGAAPHVLTGNVNNIGSLKVNESLYVASASTWTTSGSLTIAAGKSLKMTWGNSSSGASFTQTAGSIVNNGTFEQSGGAFSATGNGTQTGNPLVFLNGVVISPSGTGSGSFEVRSNANELGSDVGAGYTLRVGGVPGYINGIITIPVNRTNRGTIKIGGTDGTYGRLNVTAPALLTNLGTIVADDSLGASSGIYGNFDNQGTLQVDENMDSTGAFTWTTSGAITIATGKSLILSFYGGSFTQTAGTFVNNGSFEQADGAFLATGTGTHTGNPLVLRSAVTISPSGTGSGSFDVHSNSDVLGSDIGAGYTLRIAGIPGYIHGLMSIPVSRTNRGTLKLGGANGTLGRINVAGGATLANAGTIASDYTYAGPSAGAANYLAGSYTNSGTIDVSVNDLDGEADLVTTGTVKVDTGRTLTVQSFNQTAGSTTIGAGAVLGRTSGAVLVSGGQLSGFGTVKPGLTNSGGTVHAGGSPGVLTVNGNYSQTAGGTLAVDVQGLTPGTGFSQLAVTGSAAIAGALAVTTSVAQTGTMRILTSAGLTGTFGSSSFVGQTDTVTYDATGVVLNAVASSTSSPIFTAKTPPTTGTVGTPYTYTFAATGNPTPTFTLGTGTLPGGLTLSSTGALTGTPTTAGPSTFTIQAVNGVAPAAVTGSLTITIAAAPVAPVFTAKTPPVTGTIGTPFTYTFAATGNPAPTFALGSGSFPAGLTLSSTGALTGTPTTAGPSTFTIQAVNGVAPNAITGSITITIAAAPVAPVFTAKSPPTTGTVGTPYTYTFAATGNPTPTFIVGSGAVPSGFTLNPTTGALTGTPTTAGPNTFTVQATNGVAPNAVTGSLTITIAAAPVAPVFTAKTPPVTGTMGTPYTYTFAATGNPTPTFSLGSGSFPAGLTLSSTGALTGTPTAAGPSTFTVQASNGVAPAAVTGSITITIAAAPTAPVFTAKTPPTTGTIGTPYTYTFAATGNPTPTFGVGSGTLPSGLTLSSAGALTGTPTTAGPSTFTIQASNGVAPNAITGTLTITIAAAPVAPVFTAKTPPVTGTVGTPFTYTFAATGNPTPTFALATGAFPAGLTLNPTTGTLTGTPTTAGPSTFTVQATNGIAPVAVTGSLTITISAAPAAPVFTAKTPPVTGTIGTPYTYTFAATGNPTPTFIVSSGAVPAGLTLNPATGALTGTPTATGPSTFTVQATNGVAPNATTGTLTITIAAASAAPVFTAKTPPTTAVTGTPYTYTFAATGNPTPTFAVATGTLPAGLTLNSTTGVLSGTPTTVGLRTFTVRASNGVNPAALSGSITITVSSAPVFTAKTPPENTPLGAAFSYTFAATGSPAPTFAVATGSLPVGLTLNPTTGVLSGRPTTIGELDFTVKATNGVNPDALSGPLAINVQGPGAPVITRLNPNSMATTDDIWLWIFGSNLIDATEVRVGDVIQRKINGRSGGFLIVEQLAHAAGTVDVRVVNANGMSAKVPADRFTFFGPSEVAPVLDPNDLPATMTLGSRAGAYIHAPAVPVATYSIISGSLPPGMALDSATGWIRGSPTALGSFTYTLSAMNGIAPNATRTRTVKVVPPPPPNIWYISGDTLDASGRTRINIGATGIASEVPGLWTATVTASNSTAVVVGSNAIGLIVMLGPAPAGPVQITLTNPGGASNTVTYNRVFRPFPGGGIG